MKFNLQGKVLVTWLLLSGLLTVSDSLLSDMATSFRTYMDKVIKPVANLNMSSYEKMETAPSRFVVESEKPKTLENYLQDLSGSPLDYTRPDGRVEVVARIRDYDNTNEKGEWEILTAPGDGKQEPVSRSLDNELAEDYLEKEDFQKYIDDYHDLFYTFKDLVKIGANPSVREKLIEKKILNTSNEKTFNVTYTMPIPKTTKYFEIKMNNLTEAQYKEINSLLREYMQKKANTSTLPISKEDVLYVDIENGKKRVTSRDLTEPWSLPPWNLPTTPSPNDAAKSKKWPQNPNDASSYFHKVFTEGNYKDLINMLKSELNTTNVSMNEKSLNETTQSLMKNNGLYAEITTDYVHRHDNQQMNKTKPFQNPKEESIKILPINTTNNNTFMSQPPADHNDAIVATATTVLNPVFMNRKIANISRPTHSKRLIVFNTTQNIKRSNGSTESTFGHSIPISTMAPLQNGFDDLLSKLYAHITPMYTGKSNNNINNSQTETNNYETTTISYEKDWVDISTLFNNTTANGNSTSPPQSEEFHPTAPTPNVTNKFEVTNPMSIMQAANLIAEMKRKIEEEDRRKAEIYRNYIKAYLVRNTSNLLQGDDDNIVMKINKQDNILEELKQLMLGYFDSMKFITKVGIRNDSLSAVNAIMNATDIFQLMEQSSRLVKQSLETKLLNDKEPSGFVRRIADRQVERCRKMFNNGLVTKSVKNPPELLKKTNNKRFMAFTRCMNTMLQKCIYGFSIWLERGKFYLRPHFKLDRAYENYEIEKNLYCLRMYTGATLDSNRRGVRVRPGTKVNRKSGMRNMRMGQSNTKFRVIKIRNEGYNGVARRRNMAWSRKFNNETLNDKGSRKLQQSPRVLRYPNPQGRVYIRREQGAKKQQQSENNNK